MKALAILKKYPSVEERAAIVITSLQRNIQKNVLDPVIAKVERLEEEIADLLNFSLETNINKGHAGTSREECQKRFELVIQKEYELEIAKKELEIKTASFDKYFAEEAVKSSSL